jgi:glycosyltransferase involved in cell wall biosynthesis
MNPVIASLIYSAASKIVRDGGNAECSVDRAKNLLRCATDQLSVVLPEFQDRSFPPSSDGDHAESIERTDLATERGPLSWAVGLMTAPRGRPTIERSLASLQEAGFDSIQVFAEPGSPIPASCDSKSVTMHPRRLGTLLNFYSSADWLLQKYPRAQAIAIFQDDIEVASGLKRWCDEEFWPLDAGIVSLFTPRLHSDRTSGWRLVSPGYQRVCGAQAMVFRREALQTFLADPLVINRLAARRHNNDAVIAGWVARQRLSIAYHTPSLVQHVGHVSSIYPTGPDRRNMANAVSSVAKIESWSPSNRGNAAIGLVGWDVATGLGYQNRDLALHLAVDRWLIPRHPRLATRNDSVARVRRQTLHREPDQQELQTWLRGLDWLLFIEAPPARNLVRLAANSGVGIACVANWEWLQPHLLWLPFVDVMICPTRHTLVHLTDWKQRYGFSWELVYVPWPIDTQRFCFRQRDRCRRFLYVNGWGGAPLRRPDGSKLPYARKGFELIVGAAERAPELSFLVYSQLPIRAALPANIELRCGPADNTDLYRDGDVCLQPSHFEGLGLQLLECQAAGLPLITTNAPPMNEYKPLHTIPIHSSEIVMLGQGPIASQLMTAPNLVRMLKIAVGTDIREASRRAREFVLEHHSWKTAIELLRDALRKR